MFKGFHHIGLYVKDSARSLKFYEEGFGGKVTMSFGPDDHKIYMVELAPGAVVELIPHDTVEDANSPWAHIALHTDNCKADFDRAVAAGAKVKSEPAEHDWMTNAFVIGPDGESIEFFQTEK